MYCKRPLSGRLKNNILKIIKIYHNNPVRKFPKKKHFLIPSHFSASLHELLVSSVPLLPHSKSTEKNLSCENQKKKSFFIKISHFYKRHYALKCCFNFKKFQTKFLFSFNFRIPKIHKLLPSLFKKFEISM